MILRQQDVRHVTNHASRGQEVHDEARMCNHAPQTARSAVVVCNEDIFKKTEMAVATTPPPHLWVPDHLVFARCATRKLVLLIALYCRKKSKMVLFDITWRLCDPDIDCYCEYIFCFLIP